MEMFAALGIYIGICMLLVAIFVLGPTRTHRDGLLGKAHRVLSSIPSLIGTCCCLMCTRGRMGKAQERWHSCSESTTSKKNPALVVFYIVLVWGVDAAFLYYVVPEMSNIYRKFLSTFLVVLSEYCYIAACRADPGVVTGCRIPPPTTPSSPQDDDNEKKDVGGKNNTSEKKGDSATPTLDLLDKRIKEKAKQKAEAQVAKSPLSEEEEHSRNNRYPFDGVLYSVLVTELDGPPSSNNNGGKRGGKKNKNGGGASGGAAVADVVEVVSVQECYTCNMPRPARSKHCSMCDQCVRRYDHHCPWINNDVGEGNLKHFMAFLITHVITCLFCGTECLMNVLQFVEEAKIWRSMFVGMDGRRSPPSLGLVFMYTVTNKTVVCCVVMFAYIIGLMLLWFWGHHMWLAMRNITTNEEGKIDMVMDYVASIRNFAAFEEDIKYSIFSPPTPEKIAAAKKAGSPPPTATKGEFDEKLQRRRHTAQQQLERTKPSFLSEYVAAQIYVFYTEHERKVRGEELAKAHKKIQSKKITLGPYESPMKHVNMKALNKLRRAPESKIKKALVKTYDCGSKWNNLMEALFPETPSGVSSKTPSNTHQGRARIASITPKPNCAPPTEDNDVTRSIRKRVTTVEGSGTYIGWGGRNLINYAVSGNKQ